jgi:glycosyltransferase involved in cell wall biosynthesis
MLAQFYPPIIGGEERHVQDLSAALVERGHQVSVATLWHPGQQRLALEAGVRVHRIRGAFQRLDWLFREPVRRHAPPFPDPRAVWELWRILRLEQPDVVHGHNWLSYSFLP